MRASLCTLSAIISLGLVADESGSDQTNKEAANCRVPQRTSESVERNEANGFNGPRAMRTFLMAESSNGPTWEPVWSFNSRIDTVMSQQNFGNNQRSKSLKKLVFSAY
jgi:hypothetical protein